MLKGEATVSILFPSPLTYNSLPGVCLNRRKFIDKMKCLQLKCGYAAVLVMIERSAVVVLFGLLTTPPQEGRVFSPCEIVRQAADLDGTVISTRAEIIAGPHDDYLAVEGCTKTGAVDFVLLDLTTHS